MDGSAAARSTAGRMANAGGSNEELKVPANSDGRSLGGGGGGGGGGRGRLSVHAFGDGCAQGDG